jgi:hypothetical protein
MYLSRSEDRLHGYGGLPAVAEGIKKGIEGYQQVRDFFSSGGFKADRYIGKYTPNPRPAGVQPAKCVRKLRIATYPRVMGYPGAPQFRDDSFLFKLEYEYDGRNLLGVRILPQEKGSSTLYKSTLEIHFNDVPLDLQEDPVAHIRFYITGTFEKWDPISNDRYAIEGTLDIRADGSATVSLTSDDNMVRADPISNSCQVITPKIEIPKIPVPRHYELTVFFAREGLWKLRDGEADKIANWYWGRDPALKGLPQSTRNKIESGQLKIVVEGYASTTKGTQFNLDLSKKRANTVKAVLVIAGDKAQDNIIIFPFGEWKAGTPDEVADPKERRARITVDDLEWI